MNDRALMENLLLVTKGACDLFMHGTIESSTKKVHDTFNESLFDTLEIQDATYKTMEQYGWYQTTQVPPEKVSQTAQKFSC